MRFEPYFYAKKERKNKQTKKKRNFTQSLSWFKVIISCVEMWTVADVMVYVISLDCHMMSSLRVKAKEQANCIFHMPRSHLLRTQCLCMRTAHTRHGLSLRHF